MVASVAAAICISLIPRASAFDARISRQVMNDRFAKI
jgi:hypothetical protein